VEHHPHHEQRKLTQGGLIEMGGGRPTVSTGSLSHTRGLLAIMDRCCISPACARVCPCACRSIHDNTTNWTE
jgi:hypothetical protein